MRELVRKELNEWSRFSSETAIFAVNPFHLPMAKAGTPKNTKNKAKHTKLMDRKKKKAKEKGAVHDAKMNALKIKIAELNKVQNPQ
ncbi:MAG: hypothetical protein ACI828_001151 [Flavobacteriales bacterium]